MKDNGHPYHPTRSSARLRRSIARPSREPICALWISNSCKPFYHIVSRASNLANPSCHSKRPYPKPMTTTSNSTLNPTTTLPLPAIPLHRHQTLRRWLRPSLIFFDRVPSHTRIARYATTRCRQKQNAGERVNVTVVLWSQRQS